jgi:hypothetical protein
LSISERRKKAFKEPEQLPLSELRNACVELDLPSTGRQVDLVTRLAMHSDPVMTPADTVPDEETETRKRAAQLQEGAAKVDAANEAVKKTSEMTAPLTASTADEVSSEAAQEICEKLVAVEKAAQEKLDEARKFLMERQKEMKTADDRAELQKHLSRVNGIQVDLAKARTAAQESEQKIVAKLLMTEVGEYMTALEGQVEKVAEASSPLTEDGGRDFIVASMTKMLLDALTEHMVQSGTTKEELFKQMNNGSADTKAKEAEFVKFFEKIPDMCNRKDLAFNADQLGAVFEQVVEDESGELSQADWIEMFRERFVCSSSVSMTDIFDVQDDNCQSLSKLEKGDLLEAVGQPKTHESLGITRLQVKTLKNEAIGWVTLQGNQGTTYLEAFTTYAAFMRGLEKVMQEAHAYAAKVASFINQKSTELNDCKSGPLLETKEQLMKTRPKVSVLTAKLDQIKKKVDECAREHAKREEFERRKNELKKDKKAATVILKAIGEKVQKVETALRNLSTAAAPLVVCPPELGASAEPLKVQPDLGAVTEPLKVQSDAKTLASTVEAEISSCRESFKAQEERLANATKGPWLEAKQEIADFQKAVSDHEARASAITAGMQAACEEIGKTKLAQISSTLRAAVQAQSKTIDSLYAELAGKDGDDIPGDKFMKLESVAKLGLSAEQKQLCLLQIGASSSSIGRRSFFQMLEKYCKCVKEIAVTPEFDITAGDPLRKLELGEFIEVLEGPRTEDDADPPIPRVRGKAMTDGIVGWVTLKGNQGTAFLEESLKPSYYATDTVTMQDGFASEGTNELRALKPYEVIEVLEGPKKEIVGSALRAKGKASDGTVGWFTIKSKQGNDLAQPGKSTWSCTSAIALTDNMDIKACKVIRKLQKGEILSVLEGPTADANSGVERIRVKAKKDDKEGWVTTKGNAGTKYAEETGKCFIISKPTPLQKDFSSDSETIRMLADQEVVDLMEGPRDEQGEPPVRIRGRSLNDGAIGWVTLKGSNLKPWKPHYRCVHGTGMGDALDVATAEPLRRLEVGELLEVVEGPRVETELGVVRVKGRAESDGVVGWVTVAGNQGTKFLEVS